MCLQGQQFANNRYDSMKLGNNLVSGQPSADTTLHALMNVERVRVRVRVPTYTYTYVVYTYNVTLPMRQTYTYRQHLK